MNMTRIQGPRTIAGRLIAFSIFYASAALVVASAVLALIVANVVRDQVDQRLSVQIEAVRGSMTVSADGSLAVDGNLDGPPFDRPGSGWYWQVTSAGKRVTSRSLAGASLSNPPQPFDWRSLLTGTPRAGDGRDSLGQGLHFLTSQSFAAGKEVEIIATSPHSALISPVLRSLLLLVPAMLVLGGLLVVGILLQVRYGLSPLRKLAEAVADVSSGRARGLDQPQAEELRPLVGQINRLLEQNQARLAETRLQFANMAHGLKTPVASLYLALNDNADPTGEARRQVDRIDRQIKHHLGRARAGVSAAGLAPATMLRPCVDDIVTMMQKLYVDRDLLITSDVESTVSVACAPQDVDEIMGAMIDNAFKWAKSSVRIVGRADGGEIAIVIEDDGPGIKSDNITEVMNPGVRLDETVPGDGFGLSIAREVCELYGGRVTLMNLPEGGLSATVVLPTTPG